MNGEEYTLKKAFYVTPFISLRATKGKSGWKFLFREVSEEELEEFNNPFNTFLEGFNNMSQLFS